MLIDLTWRWTCPRYVQVSTNGSGAITALKVTVVPAAVDAGPVMRSTGPDGVGSAVGSAVGGGGAWVGGGAEVVGGAEVAVGSGVDDGAGVLVARPVAAGVAVCAGGAVEADGSVPWAPSTSETVVAVGVTGAEKVGPGVPLL